MERIRSAGNGLGSSGEQAVAAMSLVPWYFVQIDGCIESSPWVEIVMHAGRIVSVLER